jgi:hypothetical protein
MRGLVPELLAGKPAGAGRSAIESGIQSTYSARVSMYTVIRDGMYILEMKKSLYKIKHKSMYLIRTSTQMERYKVVWYYRKVLTYSVPVRTESVTQFTIPEVVIFCIYMFNMFNMQNMDLSLFCIFFVTLFVIFCIFIYIFYCYYAHVNAHLDSGTCRNIVHGVYHVYTMYIPCIY